MEIANKNTIFAENDMIIKKWKVRDGFLVSLSQVVLLYKDSDGDTTLKKLKASKVGIVKRLCSEGDVVSKGYVSSLQFQFHFYKLSILK